MTYTQEQLDEMAKKDSVIVRNDGVVLRNRFGDINVYVPQNGEKDPQGEAKREIASLYESIERMNKIKINGKKVSKCKYKYSIISYFDYKNSLK